MVLQKVVSGCQTGADQAGLDIALQLGILIGGWVPRGRRNERGRISDKYSALQETSTSNYPQRTRRNVLDSDGTLILITGSLKGGSRLTRNLAQENGRPHLVVNLNNGRDPRVVIDWVRQNDIKVLNVAGSRESSSPGIHKKAKAFLRQVLPALK